MASSEKINYRLRPNKAVERRMLGEMLSRIDKIADLSGYRYIGFGSTYFADFSLFHRTLGIDDMISIEGDDKVLERCRINKPYNCIELRSGKSGEVLPELDLADRPSIIWLDYDGPLMDYVFEDINTVLTSVTPGSFFIISVNADFTKIRLGAEKEKGSKKSERCKNYFKTLIGSGRFPEKYESTGLKQSDYHEIIYRTVINEMEAAAIRNPGTEEGPLKFHQAVHFKYSDGAQMLTIGGFIFSEAKEKITVKTMGLADLPYYRNSGETFEISCPVLSIKETNELNALLPAKIDKLEDIDSINDLNEYPIDNQYIYEYSRLYRYYPSYIESLL